MAPTITRLRSMSDGELIELYDRAAASTVVGTGFYLDELARRDLQRQTATIRRLTWAITFLTVVNVAVAAWVQLG